MAVITIFRQAGCKGRYIAENVARALDYHFADYATAERLMLQCGFEQTPQVYDSVSDFWDRFTRRGMERDQINAMLRSIVLAAAHHGDVVMLGRGCFAPLQGLCDVINVRVKAPLPLRIERIMEEHNLTKPQAAQFVEEKDALVADFARTSYGLSPDDLTLFDLVIDTSKVDPDAAVRWLVEVAGGLRCRAGDPTAAALEVAQVPKRAVAKEFKRRERLRAEKRARS
ncbi:MAG: cytidylate kinase-like family protein [Thermoleophilia bacterium]|nr:cytidylate kinase-like family protein [Thermoleophilia bacterium]